MDVLSFQNFSLHGKWMETMDGTTDGNHGGKSWRETMNANHGRKPWMETVEGTTKGIMNANHGWNHGWKPWMETVEANHGWEPWRESCFLYHCVLIFGLLGAEGSAICRICTLRCLHSCPNHSSV